MRPIVSRLAGPLAGKLKQFGAWSAIAHQQTGKNALTQMREIRALRDAGGQCGMSDYYWYKLYDDSYQSGRGAPDFLGWRLQQSFSMALNPRHAVLPAWDKLVFMALASAAGLPVTPLRAYYHRAKVVPNALGEHLGTVAAAGAFLRDAANFPVFAKPAYSQQGYGCAYLAGYDHARDALMLLDGKTVGVDAFLLRLQSSTHPGYHRPECGFMFQSPLVSAPEIRALTNWPAICGARIICLNGPHAVVPILGQWRVASEPNHVDNFSKGAYGNLMGNVDVRSGVVTRMLGGLWPETAIVVNHPRTGARLEGFQLPGWQRMLEICRQGGAAFPLMRIHHWDFAISERGPVILELNDLGGTIGSQLYGQGMLTEEIRAFLQRHGNTSAHAWIKRL